MRRKASTSSQCVNTHNGGTVHGSCRDNARLIADAEVLHPAALMSSTKPLNSVSSSSMHGSKTMCRA